MQLFYRSFSNEYRGTPLILLHGLLGSLVNWQRIARELAGDYWVIVPDLRNHGRSPHHQDVSYEAMAADVLELLDTLNVGQAVLIGHSMGGKTAMTLALQQPGRIAGLVVADIAPVRYQGSLAKLIDALLALPLEKMHNRRQAHQWLEAAIPEPAIRDYLLQNLIKTDDGWRWRSNLRALRDGIETISDFPEHLCRQPYVGPTRFIRGGLSNYVLDSHQPAIKKCFPEARIDTIEGAGHWLYSQKPGEFLALLRTFLSFRE